MPAARSRLAALVLPALLLPAGCGDLEQAAAAKGIASNDLVAQMITQLAASDTLTYTASYHLAGGDDATTSQAQKPARTAVDHPGGRLIITEKAVTSCDAAKPPACTLTAPPQGGTRLPADTYAAAQQSGLIAQPTVVALLNAAAEDTAITVKPSDTTITGRHATCLSLAGVDNATAIDFTVCVTNDGVLGTFTGSVSGTRIDMTMTDYEPSAAAGDFDPPTGARITDKRPPASA